MQPQINVSLLDAAILTGRDKSTIQKRLTHKDENKRIIGEKNDNGEWVINLASLCQHYKVPKENIEKLENKNATLSIERNTENSTPSNTEVNTNSTHEIIELRAEVKFLNQRLQDKEDEIKKMGEREQELKTEKTRFVDMLEKKDNLLTFYQEKEVEQKPEPIPPTPKTDLRPFWALLVALIMGVATWYSLSNKNVSETLKIENKNTPVQETPSQQ